MNRWLPLLCLLPLLACAQRGAEGPDADTPESVVEAQVSPIVVEPLSLVSIVPGSTAVPISRDCDRPVEETCNAIDDDCNGVIDDGCGYGSGFMQVTAAWDTGADVDLYVTGPLGDTLSFQRPSTPSGARMDHSGRGDCAEIMENSRIENIRWVGDRPVPGIYEVEVQYWGECSAPGGPTNVTVSVAVAREIAGQYRQSLLPGERIRVVRFVVQ